MQMEFRNFANYHQYFKIMIKVKNVKYHVFKELVYFIYTRKLENNLDFEFLKELYYEAEMRDIKELEKSVESRIIEMLTYNKDSWSSVLMMGWEINNNLLK